MKKIRSYSPDTVSVAADRVARYGTIYDRDSRIRRYGEVAIMATLEFESHIDALRGLLPGGADERMIHRTIDAILVIARDAVGGLTGGERGAVTQRARAAVEAAGGCLPGESPSGYALKQRWIQGER